MKRWPFCSLSVFVVLFAACAATKRAEKKVEPPNDKVVASSAAFEGAPVAPPVDATEASLKTGGVFSSRDDLRNVPFGFDSAKLSVEALAVLKANAEVVKSDPAVEILVAGNCDDRGTTAYNLALGQKRAKEVRDYYMSLGIDGARVATISYGKERPLCSDSSDECRSKNRRAETRARDMSVAK